MPTGCCLFLLGILSITRFQDLPSLQFAWLFLPILLTTVYFRPARWLLWFAAGFIWALFNAHIELSHKFDSVYEGAPVTVTGTVSSLPEQHDYYLQFLFDVSSMRDEKGITNEFSGKIRLNWYRDYPELLPGDELKLPVKLKRPHGFMNPGSFDYESWLFQQSIRATGYALSGKEYSHTSNKAFSIHRFRYHLRKKLEPLLSGFQQKSLLFALILGDRSELNREQWQVLTRTGTSHLLAISGLHIGLIAGFGFLLMRWLWPLSSRAALWIPTPHIASISALLVASLYAVMAGLTIPTQRALIMVAVILLLQLGYRQTSRLSVLAIALLAVLAFDPFAVLSAGFWLSFSAVAVIFFALTTTWKQKNVLYKWFRIQLFIFIGLMPLLVYWFQQIPLGSVIANCIAVPWVSLLSVPLVLSGVLFLPVNDLLASFLLTLGNQSLDLLWHVLDWLADLKWAVLPIPQVSIMAVLLALLGSGLLLLPAGIPAKWIGTFWLLPLFFPGLDVLEKEEFRFTLLDVGQGLAAVVQTRNHVLTYDTGLGYGGDFNTGWSVLVPYLRHSGLNKVDIHLQSHGDNDHIGGLKDFLKLFPVAEILTSVPDEVEHTMVRRCIAGQQWQWDGIEFEILHPSETGNFSGNDASCVLKVSNGQYAVLLPGDIEKRGERALLAGDRSLLQADILVVPHHGSLSSSSTAFIQAVAAKYALFPVGYRNRFGFPKQAIIQRYKKQNTLLFDTARDGAIQFHIHNDGITVETRREQAKRFWHTKNK